MNEQKNLVSRTLYFLKNNLYLLLYFLNCSFIPTILMFSFYCTIRTRTFFEIYLAIHIFFGVCEIVALIIDFILLRRKIIVWRNEKKRIDTPNDKVETTDDVLESLTKEELEIFVRVVHEELTRTFPDLWFNIVMKYRQTREKK